MYLRTNEQFEQFVKLQQFVVEQFIFVKFQQFEQFVKFQQFVNQSRLRVLFRVPCGFQRGMQWRRQLIRNQDFQDRRNLPETRPLELQCELSDANR